MSIRITLTCDGLRNGEPCRGSLSIPETGIPEAVTKAQTVGWRRPPSGSHRCPSPGHDDENTL